MMLIVRFLKKFQTFLKLVVSDLTNYQIINEIIKLKKSIILSTGLSNLSDIYDVIKFLRKNKFNYKKINFLHCNTAYPTPFKDVNLKVIPELKKTWS